MAEYGYEYRSFYTYSTGTVRNETREPIVIKPFVPSVPKSNGNNSSEGHVIRKTIVPVTGAEGRKPIGTTNHDGHNNNGTNGYGGTDYYGGNKEGRKQPIGRSTIRKNDNYHDGTNNNNGYGDKLGGRNKKDNHEYDGTNNGYGGGYSDTDDDHYYYNNNKEGYKPTSLPIRRNDGYNNNGYGIAGNGNNKEQRRPFGSTTRDNNYDDDDYANYNNREGHRHISSGPKISSAWTKAPRIGTQLSEPTHDIEKALELLKMEAAKHEHSNANKWAAPAPAPGNGSRFPDLATSKFDKKGSTGSPHSWSSMPVEPASPNKGGGSNYGSETDDHDRKGGGMRTFANFSSRPRTPIIDSRVAVKKYKGATV